MRKAIGVLIMVGVVGGFVCMMTKDTSSNEATQTTASETTVYKNASSAISSMEKEIEENYPSTATAVVEMHNELMGVCYKYDMDDKDIEDYVKTIRKLYGSELLELNPEESQIAVLKEDYQNMKSETMELVTSKITEIYVAKNDEGQEVSAEINVTHATNLGSTNRTYYLNKENGLWKINSWETIMANA